MTLINLQRHHQLRTTSLNNLHHCEPSSHLAFAPPTQRITHIFWRLAADKITQESGHHTQCAFSPHLLQFSDYSLRSLSPLALSTLFCVSLIHASATHLFFTYFLSLTFFPLLSELFFAHLVSLSPDIPPTLSLTQLVPLMLHGASWRRDMTVKQISRHWLEI